MEQQPEAESPYWGRGNAGQGEVVRQKCSEESGVKPQVLVPYFRAFGAAAAPAAPPPPSPEVLAQQAIANLYIPMPRIGIGLIVDPRQDLAVSTLADEPDMAALRSGLAPLLRSPGLPRPGVSGSWTGVAADRAALEKVQAGL
ncbi:hypothetical protein [Nakamurella sp.]|uniref:hypothetical protein n=1 Tax=Nakamurella sp. TaxID=1869182 RepID=UPI0037830B10